MQQDSSVIKETMTSDMFMVANKDVKSIDT